MSRQKKPHNETPNALKHGAYSVIAILPGEDARALDELLSRLIEEWKPSGPTEYDAVATIARCMWRKKRLQRYLLGSMDARQLDPESRAFDVKFALTAALSLLETEPECVPKALGVCPIWIREKIYAKYVPGKYANALDWNAAVRDELMAMVRSDLERAKSVGEGSWYQNVKLGAIFEDDLFTKEIATEERLDAIMDRAVKRLVQSKAMKQMLASASLGTQDSLNGQTQQRKRLSASNRTKPQPSTQDH